MKNLENEVKTVKSKRKKTTTETKAEHLSIAQKLAHAMVAHADTSSHANQTDMRPQNDTVAQKLMSKWGISSKPNTQHQTATPVEAIPPNAAPSTTEKTTTKPVAKTNKKRPRKAQDILKQEEVSLKKDSVEPLNLEDIEQAALIQNIADVTQAQSASYELFPSHADEEEELPFEQQPVEPVSIGDLNNLTIGEAAEPQDVAPVSPDEEVLIGQDDEVETDDRLVIIDDSAPVPPIMNIVMPPLKPMEEDELPFVEQPFMPISLDELGSTDDIPPVKTVSENTQPVGLKHGEHHGRKPNPKSIDESCERQAKRSISIHSITSKRVRISSNPSHCIQNRQGLGRNGISFIRGIVGCSRVDRLQRTKSKK
ncbi:MAG: hypothetical protein J6V99_06985 [Neisseriaceae bacterium]|nr:hypothetical protein [Neisseriaceae bacterium]